MNKIGATQRYRGYVIQRTHAGLSIMRDGVHQMTAMSYPAALAYVDDQLKPYRPSRPQAGGRYLLPVLTPDPGERLIPARGRRR